jgi:hypothetical protein
MATFTCLEVRCRALAASFFCGYKLWVSLGSQMLMMSAFDPLLKSAGMVAAQIKALFDLH